MVAGTPSYVAPEQARAEAPDARADQYSLAALAYLLLAGRPAFQYSSLAEAGRPATLAAISSPARPYPPEVEAVIRRGLAFDRDDRFATVTELVDALEAAVAPVVEGSAVTEAWLPVDPDLTQPGPRPALTSGGAAPPSTEPHPGPRRRGRAVVVGAVVGLVGLGLGLTGGYALERSQAPDERTVDDVEGTLSVTVPADWDGADADQGWSPPNAATATFPAVSAGTTATWAAEGSTGHGVFVGLLPGEEIPEQLPQHPECEETGSPARDTTGDVNTTVVMTGCPGGVTVERVVQVTSDTLLWIQVRSPDRATANRVLDSVRTHGL
jgi:hypothetical protein